MQSKRKFEPDRELNKLIDRVAQAAIEVHKALGPGYAEQTYENALCIELELRQIPFERQKRLMFNIKGIALVRGDWICWSIND